ncbi:MAG: M6 family metalloprotease domain-containing protein [Candidatus Zixiibacteriota bacterium]|nr:MAG: M6 family metalloprotease domain-containing protein [candidate division Zixibacteria bacterium]
MKKINRLKSTVAASVLALIFCVSSRAVTISPDARQAMEEAGVLDRYVSMIKDARTRGLNAPDMIKTSVKLTAGADDVDTVTVLVLMVDFDDNAYTEGGVAANAAEFDSVLFTTGRSNPTGSMTEYYLENSYGKFLVRGQVHGWYRMPSLYSYYVNGEGGIGSFFPNNSKGLAVDAVRVADSLGLDFSPFDTYGSPAGADGEIDGLLIVHAGPGMEQTGSEYMMISHKWDLGPYATIADGLNIDSYTIQPEERLRPGGSAEITPIGVFCHEFGHVLGLPDLYDVDYQPSSSDGIGIWSLMGTGVFKGDARIPAHLDAWCKMYVGFLDPVEVYENMTSVEFPPVENDPVAYRLWKDGAYSSQYFLVENRQPVGFDSLLPGSGLLIYHVDDNATFNNIDVNHYHVAVEQADGFYQLELNNYNDGDAGDPWPGTQDKRSFDDMSKPSSRSYAQVSTKVSVWNISEPGSLMTANLDIDWSRPYFELNNYAFVDANGNGDLEAGESVEFYFDIRNYWMSATNATITLTTNDPDIQFSNSTVFKSDMPGNGGLTDNIGEPMAFSLPDTLIPTYDSFFVEIETDGGMFEAVFEIEQQVGAPQILIVDDDRGGSYDAVYAGDLYRQLTPCDIWQKSALGSPSGIMLNQYKTVFWFTGDTCSDLLQPADIAAMKQYLDNGGNLFLTGQWVAGELHDQDSAFLENYLHARKGSDGYFFEHAGVDGSPVGDGLKVRYESSTNQVYGYGQQILPVNGAIPAFKFTVYPEYTGVSYSGEYKVVFFNFGYEAISSNFSRYNKREEVLARLLQFFGSLSTEVADDVNGPVMPGSFELGQNFPNPFNPATTIRYTVRSTQDMPQPKTTIRIFNLLGREVKILVDEVQSPGVYETQWDGTNKSGRPAASGIYFYRMTRGVEAQTKKMVLLK